MKKILPLFLLIVYISNAGLKFDYEKLNIDDIYGIVHNDNCILFYGNSSNFLKTNFFTSEWVNIQPVLEPLAIKKIRTDGNEFYGVYNKKYFFKLNENADLLETITLPDSLTDEIVDIYKLSNKYYMAFKDKVLAFNLDFQFFKEINIPDGIEISGLCYFRNSLLIATKNSKILKISPDNQDEVSVIDLYQRNLTDSNKTIRRFVNSNGYLYFISDSLIYKTNNLEVFEEIYSKTKLFDVNDDILYSITTGTIDTRFNYNQVLFYKNDGNGTKTISNNELDRYVTELFLMELNFINDDLIFAAGKDNSIIKSTNGGVTWEVLSNYEPKANVIWIDSLNGFFWNTKAKIFKTTNGGITWRPQLLTDKEIIKFKNKPFTAHFDEMANGVLFTNRVNTGYPNVMKTTDGGETFKIFRIEETANYSYSEFAPLVKYNNEYKLYFPSRFASWPYTLLFTFDEDINYKSKQLIDSLHLFSIKEYKNQYYALARDMRYDDGEKPDTCVYHILKSGEPGITWDTVITMRTLDTIINFMDIIDDYVYLGGIYWTGRTDTNSFGVLYRADLKNKSYKLLRFDNIGSYIKIVKWENKIITGSINGLYYSENSNNFNNIWKTIELPGYSPWALNEFQDNQLFSYGIGKDFLKFTFHEDTPVEELHTEVIKMYNYPPYPQPANNHVSTEIYWDARYDMQNATITVHDYTGKTISKPGEISVNKMNVYHGEIIWDCSSVSSGVYFINIRLGGTTRTVPVVVGR